MVKAIASEVEIEAEAKLPDAQSEETRLEVRVYEEGEYEVADGDGKCGDELAEGVDYEIDNSDPAAEGEDQELPENAEETATSDVNDGIDSENSPEAIYERQVRECRDEYAASGLRIYHAKEELKLLKECHKELEERLSDLESRGPRRDWAASGVSQENGSDPAAESEHATSAAGLEENQQQPAETNWRAVAVEDLGLPNQMAKILRADNGIGTLGELADFADRNSGEFKALKKFGPAKASKLRDELLPAFWQRHPELIPGAEADSEKVAEEAEEREGAKADHSAGSKGETSPDGFDAIVLEARADELLAEGMPSSKLSDPRYWDSGREAFGRGVELTECPYATADERDDWLRGWLCSKGLAVQYGDDEEHEEDEDEQEGGDA